MYIKYIKNDTDQHVAAMHNNLDNVAPTENGESSHQNKHSQRENKNEDFENTNSN